MPILLTILIVLVVGALLLRFLRGEPRGEGEETVHVGDALDSVSTQAANLSYAGWKKAKRDLKEMDEIVEWFAGVVQNHEYETYRTDEHRKDGAKEGYIECVNNSGFDFYEFCCPVGLRTIDGDLEKVPGKATRWRNGEKGNLYFPWPDFSIVGLAIDVNEISYAIKRSKEEQQAIFTERYPQKIKSSDHGSDFSSVEEAMDYARDYMAGLSYYDTNDAMTSVESYIYDSADALSFSDIQSMCIDAADIYNNYSSYDNVPSRNGGLWDQDF